MSASDRPGRTFASPGEAIRDLAGVARRVRPLVRAYTGDSRDPALRERVMIAVSNVNSCRRCIFVHEGWASRAGVTSEDLQAIGLGDLGALNARSRAAVAYAVALAESRFRGPVAADLAANAGDHLTPGELTDLEAVARAIAFVNLSANTVQELSVRLRSLM